MSKHTPGPWEVTDLRHGIIVRTESPNKTKFGASRYAAIGGFERSNPDQLAEALANARLIAAAPELLGALKWLAACVKTPGPHMDAFAALEKAQAAIAKATGGEE
jgi:hypothetical protein